MNSLSRLPITPAATLPPLQSTAPKAQMYSKSNINIQPLTTSPNLPKYFSLQRKWLDSAAYHVHFPLHL
jgi:hypothetical protein